jgi:hypothetical protein
MAWVVGVFNDFPGVLFTQPDIEVLDGRELGPSDVLGCLHHHAIKGGAIAIPGSDAASQDAINGTAATFRGFAGKCQTFSTS